MSSPNESELKTLIEKQRRFFESGETRALSFRIRQLKLLSEMIRKNRMALMQAVSKDLSRHDFETYFGEIDLVLKEIRFARENLRSWMRPEYVPTPPIYWPGKSYIVKESLGTILIISPWNYPILLLLGPLVGAIAAGNCAVLKPSRNSRYTSTLCAKMIRAGYASEYISVVDSEKTDIHELISTPFDHIFYTGSSDKGKAVMEAASHNLTPVTLELGGKSPCIIDHKISLRRTARRVCFGKFFNAGQTCVAPDYLLVKEELLDKLLEHIVDVIRERYGDDPSQSKDFGRIISDQHFDRLFELMQCGKIVAGGIADRGKRYISPTVLIDADPDSPLMKEEIFGPLLPVLTYRNIDEAISFVNARPKPLALYVFTGDRSVSGRIINETSSGGVLINDTLSHFTVNRLPFGGIGQSGIGSYHGKRSFDTFTHEKSVMKRSLFPDPSLRYPPYRKPGRLLRWIINLVS